MATKMIEQTDFVKLWPEGYNSERGIGDLLNAACLELFADKTKTCLEIGCGGGYWINGYLVHQFGRVIGVDVISRPVTLHESAEYFELADRDYTCEPIADESIDFVWCYDVFCHLPNSAVYSYFRHILRVLKPGGQAVLGFANWKTHPGMQGVPNGHRFREVAHTIEDRWFYMDDEIVDELLNAWRDIASCRVLLPDFRDRIVHVVKKEGARA